MTDYLKTYKIKLEVLGPVFVGSGNSIGKKEYIFNKNKNEVIVPDMPKMYQWMSNHNLLGAFEKYLLEGREDFSIWLKTQNIYEKDYNSWVLYKLDSGSAVFENRGKKEILTFMKDSYGCPYIPGSSLKGAIRTVLLGTELYNHNGVYVGYAQDVRNAEFNGRKKYLSREIKGIETSVFNKNKRNERRIGDAVNDIMAGLIISDSKPLSTVDLILCQKIDQRPDGEEKKINILRECLRPETRVEFDLTIDTQLFKKDVEDIRKSISVFLQSYNECFSDRFKNVDKYRENVIYLGGGSGFPTKTVTYQLLGENDVKTVSKIIDNTLSGKSKKEHRHSEDIKLGVSPHTIKRTVYKGKKYSFGACKIEIN